MFRFTITDAFGHILARLQKLVTDETKTSSAVLPRNVTLEEVTKKVTSDLKKKTDAIYSEKEITIVVTFDVEDNDEINFLEMSELGLPNSSLRGSQPARNLLQMFQSPSGKGCHSISEAERKIYKCG